VFVEFFYTKVVGATTSEGFVFHQGINSNAISLIGLAKSLTQTKYTQAYIDEIHYYNRGQLRCEVRQVTASPRTRRLIVFARWRQCSLALAGFRFLQTARRSVPLVDVSTDTLTRRP